MEITEIPFNSTVGLERSPSPNQGLLKLNDSPSYHNHLGTVHAAAQSALAEACSGEYLLRRFPEMVSGHIGTVRKEQVMFREPARGELHAHGLMSEETIRTLETDIGNRGRAFTEITVDVTDSHGVVTMTVVFQWYVQALEVPTVNATISGHAAGTHKGVMPDE